MHKNNFEARAIIMIGWLANTLRVFASHFCFMLRWPVFFTASNTNSIVCISSIMLNIINII